MISLSLIVLCALGALGTLYADASGRATLEWLAKPLAALAFVMAAWHWGAWNDVYGRCILLGLVFGAAGDVLLIPKRTGPAFLLGMLAFLGGHLMYAVAFWGLPQDPRVAAGVLVLSLGLAAGLLRWMMPGVPAPLKWPVRAYHLVIFAMLVLACSAVAAGATPSIAVAAIGFAASDVAVARNRFVAPGFVNRAWGIPLYFASQMLMASTVLGA